MFLLAVGCFQDVKSGEIAVSTWKERQWFGSLNKALVCSSMRMTSSLYCHQIKGVQLVTKDNFHDTILLLECLCARCVGSGCTAASAVEARSCRS